MAFSLGPSSSTEIAQFVCGAQIRRLTTCQLDDDRTNRNALIRHGALDPSSCLHARSIRRNIWYASARPSRNRGLSQLKLYLLTTLYRTITLSAGRSVLITVVITTRFFNVQTRLTSSSSSPGLPNRAAHYAFDENVKSEARRGGADRLFRYTLLNLFTISSPFPPASVSYN